MKAITVSTDDCGHTSEYECPDCHVRGMIYFSYRHWYRQLAGVACPGCGALLDIPQVVCKYPRASKETSR